MRFPLASLLIFALLSDASAANPVALTLANAESPPEVTDPAASNSHEAAGEPTPEGELDTADLSKLGARLSAIALAYESFRGAANHDSDSKLLIDYTSPQGLIPNPGDHAQTLDRVYRALALLDDTQALRYPQGEACARSHRLALLRSPDGLFADPQTGVLAPWLKAELRRAKANDAPGGLIAASVREWTALGYLKSLAEARALSLQLGDRAFLGAPRAAAFCRRAKVYEELAGAQAALKWNDPDLSEQAKAVVEVVSGKEKGAGTVLLVDGKTVVLVSGRFTENPYEAPALITKSGKHLSASYLRRGPTFSLLSIQPSPDIAPLVLPEVAEQGERVTYAVGHPIQGGPWSVTRGLARQDGALIVTDAVIEGSQAGGPLFDGLGRLTGFVAGQGSAYGLASIKDWIKNENAELPEAPAAPESGTGSLLTASAAFTPKENAGPIEASFSSMYVRIPNGVCADPRGCELPRAAPSYSSPSSNAPYNGPNLWVMLGKLGKLLTAPPKKEVKIPDNRPSTKRKAASPPVQAAPKPPPDPLKPDSLKLSVSRTTVAQGEEFEATATITFKGKEGSIGGRGVSFTGTPGGKIKCSGAKTDGSGVATATCMALEDGRVTTFDSLEDEIRRRRGQKTAGRVRRKVAKGDKIGILKERQADQMSALDGEEGKHPELGSAGTDTPGIDKPPLPEVEITEFEIKGDRVTLGASIESLIETIALEVLERPCPEGASPAPLSSDNSARCGQSIWKPGNDESGTQNLKSGESQPEPEGEKPVRVNPGERVPAPQDLEAFPGAERVRRKTPVKGGGGLRPRWKDGDGIIYEWDSQHGAVEKYNPRGKHLGEFDPETGEQTKPADKTRNVEP